MFENGFSLLRLEILQERVLASGFSPFVSLELVKLDINFTRFGAVDGACYSLFCFMISNETLSIYLEHFDPIDP